MDSISSHLPLPATATQKSLIETGASLLKASPFLLLFQEDVPYGYASHYGYGGHGLLAGAELYGGGVHSLHGVSSLHGLHGVSGLHGLHGLHGVSVVPSSYAHY